MQKNHLENKLVIQLQVCQTAVILNQLFIILFNINSY